MITKGHISCPSLKKSIMKKIHRLSWGPSSTTWLLCKPHERHLAALASFWGFLKHRAKQEPTEKLNSLKEGSSIVMHYIRNWGEGVVQDFFPPQSWSSPKLTQQSFKAISVYNPWRLGAYSNGKRIHNKSNEGVTAIISVPLEAGQFSQHRNIKLATSVHCNLMISWFINLSLWLTSINSDWNCFSAIMSGLLTHKLSWSFEDGSSCTSST